MQLTESLAPRRWQPHYRDYPGKPSAARKRPAHGMSSQRQPQRSRPAAHTGLGMRSALNGLRLDPDKNNVHNRVRRYEASNHTSPHLYGCNNHTKTWLVSGPLPHRYKVLPRIGWYYCMCNRRRLGEEHLRQIKSVDNGDEIVKHIHSPRTLLMFIKASSKSDPFFL